MRYSTDSNAKNFGYGKKINFAAKNGLNERYGGGHFATVAAHRARFKQFTQHLKNSGIKDLKKVELQHLQSFANNLKNKVEKGEVKAAYAQSQISTVNVIMSSVRADNRIKIAPSFVGARNNIRTSAPKSLSDTKLQHFFKNTSERSAAVMSAGRDLGLREREAILMNYREAVREAQSTGKITITEGTKGARGKSSEIRQVPISPRAMRVLEQNALLQGERNNLIKEGETFKQVNNQLHGSRERAAFAAADLKSYHDGRAAYACERYEQITGHQAPCVQGFRSAPKAEDKAARGILLSELGHGNKREVTAYIGSAK